jgi:hypothetical protein
MHRASRARAGLLIVASMSISDVVRASDGNLPRTAMLHEDVACLTVVDREHQPIVELAYTIPFSDTCVGPHEPEGSRTHRYVALCRTPEPWEALPHWLDAVDVMASIASGALLEQERPADDDVLTGSARWGDCHALVGALPERNPIHCQHALEGFRWDTRGLPPGGWVLAGYTYHPPMNMWSKRAGVFKVIDGASSDDPPAVGLHPHPAYAGDDPLLEVRACVDARAGSTVHVSAAPAGSIEEPWVELASMVVDDGKGDVVLEVDFGAAFDAPKALALRVEVRDPAGRSFAYVSPDPVLYVGGVAPETPPPPEHDYCEDPAALDPQNCPPMPSTSTTTAMEDDTASGCGGCSAGARPLDSLGWIVVLFAGFPSRRTRSLAQRRAR